MSWKLSILFPLLLVFGPWAHPFDTQAKEVRYDLVIEEKQVNFTGTPVQAMTINGSIPGPVLRFTEGDDAVISVNNKMNQDTSIHWHGILLPPGMDGVPKISFPPIKPGQTFVYRFPIRQSGTYWYHSHSGLQEQKGLYGAFVIEPKHKKDSYPDFVAVLSDWTNESTQSVIHNLKRGSEWYALQKGGSQSIFGAMKLGRLSDYFKRELTRMPPMDISDVAYDLFLINGKPQTHFKAQPGTTIRLRVINGSATSFFYLEFANGHMTIVSADGIDVKPLKIKRLLIGVAETYDILLSIPQKGSYEFKATAHDGSSFASAWFGKGKKHFAPKIPRPDLYHFMGDLSFAKVFALTPQASMGMPDHAVKMGKFDTPGMHGMHEMGDHQMPMPDHKSMQLPSDKKQIPGHGHSMTPNKPAYAHTMMSQKSAPQKPPEQKTAMSHAEHKPKTQSQPHKPAHPKTGKKHSYDFSFLGPDIASSENLATDGGSVRPWPPYDQLRATKPTAFAKNSTRRDIRLTLDGDMERYVWFLDNKPLSEKDDIVIKQGEVVRFILINRTMMHHPMHLHGHFFRVINSQGDYSPLKHTVDVPPMSTTVIEFLANETGDWFFHCHLLYHMKAGMARLIHYQGFEPPAEVMAIRPDLYKDSWYFWAKADLLTSMTQGYLRLSNTRNILNAQWEAGWQKVDKTDWETILTWDYSINRFTSVFIGADFMGHGDEDEKIRGVGGIRYLLPLNIHSTLWLDTDLGFRAHLDKEWTLTPRLSLETEVEYDYHTQWEGLVGLNYTINNHISVIANWHSEFGWGVGLSFVF